MSEPKVCPKCGDAMLRYYRKIPYEDAHEWAWMCPSCRHVERERDQK